MGSRIMGPGVPSYLVAMFDITRGGSELDSDEGPAMSTEHSASDAERWLDVALAAVPT